MADYAVKYADGRGQIHQQVAAAASEKELREKYTQQGFLVYSIKARGAAAGAGLLRGRKKLDLEKFLIFNQQFVTLIRAGLPILKSLDLLAERLTDPKLGPHIRAVRDEVRSGTLLSEAFRQQGVFPKIYVTSVMAGEKSGSLTEVLDRYITYQKLSLSVKKKVLVSLMYPAVLIVLVIGLMIFLVTYVVPTFAGLYSSMNANLPTITQYLIAVGTTARSYILVAFGALVGLIFVFRWWVRREQSRETVDRIKLRLPIAGDIWLKYQVAQLSRILSTLLVGGIPLVQSMETAADSLGTPLLKRAVEAAGKMVREGQPLSGSLKASKMFPPLAIDMIEVGESTGALPAMLNSVAEFFEEDVNTRMTAVLSLVEPAIMIVMGSFVAFVLIALYLPIFSLADTIR
ncbi:MAG TPA: type II secretion system F family protein [Candidatus Acidoferrales bacterium]|nr:type II secretion system F family protein [Candidatus Acidoferrales bacterium]HXK05820.1 type II secretion system F family protein [Verrucomicrobiae bacterium]